MGGLRGCNPSPLVRNFYQKISFSAIFMAAPHPENFTSQKYHFRPFLWLHPENVTKNVICAHFYPPLRGQNGNKSSHERLIPHPTPSKISISAYELEFVEICVLYICPCYSYLFTLYNFGILFLFTLTGQSVLQQSYITISRTNFY